MIFFIEKIIAEFPYWHKCDHMWHDNPIYDARQFNASPGVLKFDCYLIIYFHF